MTVLSRRPDSVTVNLSYHGAMVTLQISDASIVDIETTIDGLLARNGWAAPASVPPSESVERIRVRREQRQAQRIQPIYDSHGAPCCPVHRRQLSMGQFGYYCTAQARDGQDSNDKGFCSLRFEH